ncbi:hypothetical protein PENANT_c036G01857 [Penicillium antarcticum]|uniref:Uncharacterized protein n=1 Tax=Penicillium antarcticum TaxID=416450 RepID=A0A1V6PTX5_9EURO|nr:hypothetical protein PENANT_c036G01857 [Penicillium antarcticum]
MSPFSVSAARSSWMGILAAAYSHTAAQLFSILGIRAMDKFP